MRRKKEERHPRSNFGDFQSPIKTSILDIFNIGQTFVYTYLSDRSIKMKYAWLGTMLKKMTKMVNSLVEYIALLRQLASFRKGWVGDRYRNRSITYTK